VRPLCEHVCCGHQAAVAIERPRCRLQFSHILC
jgi:hypothetical protein